MESPSPLPYRRNSAYGERKPLLLTGYRFLVILLTTGFGLWKAKLSYHGLSTSPNTLDWLYGVIAFLTLYWLGIYERYAKHNKKWWIPLMFEVDYLVVFWRGGPVKLWRALVYIYQSLVGSSEDVGHLRLRDD